MGFLKKLLGIGVLAGAAVAGVKLSEKVKENNPEGVQDINEDGKVDISDYASEYKKAADELYGDKVAAVKDAVTEAVQDPAGTAEKVKESVKEAIEKMPETAEKVKESVKGAIEKVPETAEKVKEKVKDTIEGLAKTNEELDRAVQEAAEDFAESYEEVHTEE